MKIGNQWSKVNSLFFIAVIFHARGEFSRAIEHIRSALPLAIEIGHPGMGFMWVQLVWVYQSAGDLPNARVTIDQALDATSHFPPFMVMSQINAAIVSQKSGDIERARRYIQQVESSEHQRVLLDIEFALLFAKIGQARLEKDLIRSLEYCEHLVSRARETGAEFFLPEALFLYGIGLLELNRLVEAKKALEESENEARQLDYRIVLWRNLAAQARLAQLLGEQERIPRLIQEGAQVVHWITAHLDDPALRDSFLHLVEAEAPELSAALTAA